MTPEPRVAAEFTAGLTTRPSRGRRNAGILVGLVGLGGLVALRVLSPETVPFDLSDAARDFVTLTISVVIESLPFVFLGIALSVVVQLWVPDRVIVRLLPRNPALRRLAISVLGVVLPVCECGNVPLSRGLIVRGVSVSDAMTFLLAAPIVNPVTIITTYQAFGWNDGILVSRILGGFLIANLVGWIFSRHPTPWTLLTPSFQATCAVGSHQATGGHKLRRSVQSFAHETSAMLPALFIGSAVAGFIQVAVSRELLVTLGSNPVWSVFVLMLLAFVVSMCSNVDAFFILALGSTFMPGAIVAFLVFGPMIDIKMLALMRTTFTTRTLVQLTVLVGLASAALGLGLNLAL